MKKKGRNTYLYTSSLDVTLILHEI